MVQGITKSMYSSTVLTGTGVEKYSCTITAVDLNLDLLCTAVVLSTDTGY